MTALFLIATATVCVALSRLHLTAFAGTSVEEDDREGWEVALAAGSRLLRPWLVIGPICWLAAFTIIAATHDGTTAHAAAVVLGLFPLHGVLLTAGAGALKVASELRASELVPASLGVTAASAVAFGISAGTLLRAASTYAL